MRSDSLNFSNLNEALSRSPVFVVELSFDSANTDLHYLCSHTVEGLTGNIINDTLQSISSTSQKINPEKALSTIGSISFECLDVGLTDLQRSKLQSGDGLKSKRVRVYKGFEGLDWSDYALIQTQVISDTVGFKDGVYTFSCADVQRVLRKEIFDLKETALSSSLSRSATTINVYDTSQFELVKQPPSPSGITDAPNQTVGYLKIENDNSVEVIRYTGKTSGSFTGCTRGVLGTRPLDVEVNTSEADKATKVTEYVYLELPAPKLIYALLTGVLYGQPEGLPDHWHLGLAAEFVKTSDFTSIGSDWWDLTNDDKGVPAVIKGVEKTDGKKFIEEELLIMLGAFMPIYVNGELGLKRMTGVFSGGGFDRLLNERNVVRYGELKHDLGGVINQIILAWNYVEARGGFTRRSVLVDPQSIVRNGESKPLELELRALETSRHSYSTIKSRFDALRDRYAGPPLRLQLTLVPTENDLEIGDIVRVALPQIKDFTQNGEGISRNFEVQRVTQDWLKGEVKVDLFGSSAIASPVPEEEPDTVIESSFYTSLGTEISSANFGGAVSESGGTTTISGTITLNGASNVNSSNSIFYCNQDLTLNAGAKIIINENVQIRVNGFFQVNGTIDGKGRGFSGGDGVSFINDWSNSNTTTNNYDSSSPYRGAGNDYTKGFIDPVQIPQKGGYALVNGGKPDVWPERVTIFRGGSRNSAPILDLKFNGSNTIEGLPSDLRGSAGMGGGCVAILNTGTFTIQSRQAGSNGGDSGAGLAIVCRGADIGANGVIDTSGNDAQATTSHNVNGVFNVKNSSGTGGACGAVYWLLDGVTSTPPTLNEVNSVANIGKGQDVVIDPSWILEYTFQSTVISRTYPNRIPNGSTLSMYKYGNRLFRENIFQAAHKIQFVTGLVTVDNDTAAYAQDASITLAEFTNTPVTNSGDRSTIEVSITPPSDDEYSYSEVQYRKLGDSAWTSAPPSPFESLFEVKSDGSTYEVRTLSVSVSGRRSPSGPISQITVTDVQGKTSAELAALYPLNPITGLSLDESGTVFTGLGPNFVWDNSNAELIYFSFYDVKIYNGATLLRTEKTVSPFFTYSFDKNRIDHKAETGSDGFYTDIEIRVAPVSKYRDNLNDLYSGSSSSLTVTASNVDDPNNLRFYTIVSVDDERINNNVATPYSMVESAPMLVQGAKIEKVSSPAAWDGEVYSLEGYRSGAFLSFRTLNDDKNMMLGLAEDRLASAGFNELTYCIYLKNNGQVDIRTLTTTVATDVTSYAVGDVFNITYDNVDTAFYKNGSVIHTLSGQPPEKLLYFDCSFFDVGAAVESVSFGSVASADWDSIGGSNKPDDNADVTSDNTAQDSANTGGLPSAVVRGGSGLYYKNGMEDGEFDDYIDGSGVVSTRTTGSHSGEYALAINANTLDDSTSDYLSDQIPKFPIPEATIMALAGRKVRIKAMIKQSSASDTQFASISLIRPDSNAFGFGVFGNDIFMPNYSDWTFFSKEYDIEDVPPAGDYFIGIEPDDSSGSTKGLLIDQLIFEPITDSKDIVFDKLSKAPIMAKISSSGALSGNNLPSGWTASKVSTGRYELNHNSGYSGWPIIATCQNAHMMQTTEGSNEFQFRLYFSDGTTPVDGAVTVLLDYRYGL